MRRQNVLQNSKEYTLGPVPEKLLLWNQGGILSGILASRMTRNPHITGEISGQKAFHLILEHKISHSSQNWYLGSRYSGRNI